MSFASNTSRKTSILEPFVHAQPRMLAELGKESEIVAFRHDGLFARLFCFLNAIRVARYLEKEVSFLWLDSVPSKPAPHNYDSDWRAILKDRRIGNLPNSKFDLNPRQGNYRNSRPLILPGETYVEALNDLGKLARGLVLADGQTIADAIAGQRYELGIHARQGDSAHLSYLVFKYFPKSGWLKIISEFIENMSGKTIFLASDSKELLAQAKEIGGKAVLVPEEVIPSGSGKLVSDFHECLYLSRANRLIGPRYSAFSKFAEILSGVPVETPEEYLGISEILYETLGVAARSYVQDVEIALAIDSEDNNSEEVMRKLQHRIDRAKQIASANPI